LGSETEKTIVLKRGVIESENLTHIFTTKRSTSRTQVPQPGFPMPVQGIMERLLSEGWEENSEL
jgi:hypothetical protein